MLMGLTLSLYTGLRGNGDSGGLLLYFRTAVADGISLILKQHDDVVWFDNDNFQVMCLCYMLPAGSPREGFTEADSFDRITDQVVQLTNNSDSTCTFVISRRF